MSSVILANNEFIVSATAAACVVGIANIYQIASFGNVNGSAVPMFDASYSASAATLGQTPTGLGIGTLKPNCYLDVVFNMAIRAGASTVVGGSTNGNFVLNNRTVLELTFSSGTGAFIMTGFAGGTDGLVLDVYNFTGAPVTYKHLNGSLAANQIMCPAGADVVLPAGPFSLARFRYSAFATKWLLISHT